MNKEIEEKVIQLASLVGTDGKNPEQKLFVFVETLITQSNRAYAEVLEKFKDWFNEEHQHTQFLVGNKIFDSDLKVFKSKLEGEI